MIPRDEALKLLQGATAQLRHAYQQLVGHEGRWSRRGMHEFADGLIAPQIRKLESLSALLEVAPSPTPVDGDPLVAACMDCGLPYERFPLDVLLPRAQWLRIHPDEGGLLCAACIVQRVKDRIPGATVIHAVAEVTPHTHAPECRTNAWLNDGPCTCKSPAPAPSPEGWQPIEIAPRDGAPILARLTNGCYVIAHWGGGTWQHSFDGVALRLPLTHWMFLPASPAGGDR